MLFWLMNRKTILVLFLYLWSCFGSELVTSSLRHIYSDIVWLSVIGCFIKFYSCVKPLQFTIADPLNTYFGVLTFQVKVGYWVNGRQGATFVGVNARFGALLPSDAKKASKWPAVFLDPINGCSASSSMVFCLFFSTASISFIV